VCILEDLRDGGEEASYDPCQLQIKVPRKTIKAARRRYRGDPDRTLTKAIVCMATARKMYLILNAKLSGVTPTLSCAIHEEVFEDEIPVAAFERRATA